MIGTLNVCSIEHVKAGAFLPKSAKITYISRRSVNNWIIAFTTGCMKHCNRLIVVATGCFLLTTATD